jgi:hypothetical protein
MFFHIPLPESYTKADVSKTGSTLDVGERLDDGGAPKHNSGFFANGILKARESEDHDSPTEVKVCLCLP